MKKLILTSLIIFFTLTSNVVWSADYNKGWDAFDSGDYATALRNVERKCEVYRYSDNYGDLECSGSDLRVVERKCEAYFSSEDDKYGDIECSGSELRPIERHCSASMYSDRYGDIDC